MINQIGTQPKKRGRKRGTLVVAGLILAVCAALLLLAHRSGLLESGLSGALSVYGNEPFSLGGGSRAVFCAYGGGVAACSNQGPLMIDKTGRTAARVYTSLDDPAVSAGEDACIFWDGGTPRAWISSEKNALTPILASGDILFASAGPSSALLLTKDEGYRSTVTVYDTEAQPVFVWHSAENTVLSARISPDGVSLAAVGFNGQTWTVRVFDIRAGTQTADFTAGLSAPGTGYFDLAWLSKNSLCALSASGASFFDRELKPAGSYGFEGKTLLDWAADDFVLLALAGSDGKATLVSLDGGGAVLGTLELDRAPRSLSLRGGKALVADGEGRLLLYGRDLKQLGKLEEADLDEALLLAGNIVAARSGLWGQYFSF